MTTDSREPYEDTGGASERAVVRALIALIALTAVSLVMSYLPIGHAHAPVALAIAAVKAVVVVYAFMEIGHASTPARIVVVTTLAFIALLCAGTIADVKLR